MRIRQVGVQVPLSEHGDQPHSVVRAGKEDRTNRVAAAEAARLISRNERWFTLRTRNLRHPEAWVVAAGRELVAVALVATPARLRA